MAEPPEPETPMAYVDPGALKRVLDECDGMVLRIHPGDLTRHGKRLLDALGVVVVPDERAPRADKFHLGDRAANKRRKGSADGCAGR